MQGYFIFIFVAATLLILGDITRRKGFDKLTIRREAENSAVIEGEEFKITTIIENNKLLPISFMVLEEKIPVNIPRIGEESYTSERGLYFFYLSKFSILWNERMKRTFVYKAEKRGTYLLKEVNVSIGDIFGFSSDSARINDFVEILVYPKIIDIRNFNFESTNIQGDSIVKRWIYKDPLYIRGIREYNVEDRMKDIHWKSSLKMDKLMVKDYDYTSEREIVIILNVQCGEPYWGTIIASLIENGIKLAVSLASQAIKEGIAVGIWTNAQLVSFSTKCNQEVKPSLNSLKGIMELCARVDYTPRIEFHEMLKEKITSFNTNSTYIIITPFLNEESEGILLKLKRSGVLLKLIDVSDKSKVPAIDGIEKIEYKGEY